MNYFEFFDIPMAFIIDKGDLKRRFYEKSKELHPDFHTLSSEEKQEEMLDAASVNNEAFKVLNSFDSRMKYILEETGVMPEEGKARVPEDFLMEMMEINEALMMLEMDPDREKIQSIKESLIRKKEIMLGEVMPYMQDFDANDMDKNGMKTILEFYLKRRYLERIFANLEKMEKGIEQTS